MKNLICNFKSSPEIKIRSMFSKTEFADSMPLSHFQSLLFKRKTDEDLAYLISKALTSNQSWEVIFTAICKIDLLPGPLKQIIPEQQILRHFDLEVKNLNLLKVKSVTPEQQNRMRLVARFLYILGLFSKTTQKQLLISAQTSKHEIIKKALQEVSKGNLYEFIEEGIEWIKPQKSYRKSRS